MAEEVIPASPDQLYIPVRQSDRRHRNRLSRKFKRPRRLPTGSADINFSGNCSGQVPTSDRLAHEPQGDNVLVPLPSSSSPEASSSNAAPLTREHAYASARLFALGDTMAANRWKTRAPTETRFQTLGEIMTQKSNQEEADLFEDLVSAADVEGWATQMTPVPGHKTPPQEPEPTIEYSRPSSRCSIPLSSPENTPQRKSQPSSDSDAEELLEQTMRGIVDVNDEAGLAVHSQHFSVLSQSFEMIETTKWPAKIESTKFSAFSLHEDMDRMPPSAEKRKSTDEPVSEAPPKKLHLEEPQSPSSYLNEIICDELFNDEFTQLQRPAEAPQPIVPDTRPEVPEVVPAFVGFATANGGQIRKAALSSKKPFRKNIFDGIDDELRNLFGAEATELLQPDANASDEVFQGFQLVSKVYNAGVAVKLKKDLAKCEDQAIIESKPMPQSVTDSDKSRHSVDSNGNQCASIGFGGFALASGNANTTKKNAPKKNIFAGIDEEIENEFRTGFYDNQEFNKRDTAINNSDKMQQSATNSHKKDVISNTAKFSSTGFSGFALASGSIPKTKCNALKKDIFAGIDEEIENDFRLGVYDYQAFKKRGTNSNSTTSTPNSKRFHAASAHAPSTSSSKPTPSPMSTTVTKPSMPDFNGASPSPVLKSANNRLNTPTKPSPVAFNMAAHLLNNRSSTPISKPPAEPLTLTQEVSSCRAIFLQDEDEAISLGRSLEDNEFLAAFAGHNPPSAIAAPTSPRRNKNLRQTKLLHRFETAAAHETTDDGIAEINDSLDENLMQLTEQASKMNWQRPVLTEDVAAGRKHALLGQSQAVASKPESDKRQMAGSLFTKKHRTSGPRQSLNDFFGGSLKQMVKSGSKLFAKVSEVKATTAETFKFDMEDYHSAEVSASNVEGVALADRATLIFNELSQAGLAELKSAFLSQPGVNPQLIPNGWVENAYKWVVVKLAALELWNTSRGGTLTQFLNPEMVLLQLKYRYDREIDLVQRPAIQKILEKDDSPAKPMVLFVAQVFEMDMELSDGWYGIRTKLDTPLRHFIKTGRIKVGTKLMIQNAELVGADDTGCTPLDVPGHVRLAIFANSTRVAKWDTKLGFCPHPRPLRIPLDSVLENGGVISEAVGCILRVYPMMYVDKSSKTNSGSSVLRSEKVQQRHNLQVDSNRLAIIEETYHKVQQEINAEDKLRLQRFRDKRKSLPTRLADIKDADELSDLLEFSHDPAEIEAELTATQKKLVIDRQAAAKASRDVDIADRVRVKLGEVYGKEQQVCPLLKLRICDAQKPEKNMMLSIWRPSDDNRAMLKEGSFLKMSNVSANAMRYNVAQLTAGKSSKFEILDSKLFVRRQNMLRKLTPISEIACGDLFAPFANEFDVVGVVVKIGEMSKFQQVYFADADLNLLIVNFWGGVKQFAYDDTIQVRKILYASNVQWRPSDTSYNGVAKSYTTEFTTFKQRPSLPEANVAIAELTTALSSTTIEDFVRQCLEKIDEVERRTPLRNTSLLNRTPTPLSSTSSNQQSFVGNVTPREYSPGVGQPKTSVRDRIEYLSRIPSPPRVPSFDLTWNSNYRRRKVPTRRNPSKNIKD